ncbi:MAG: hypothetical protein QF479_01210 [Candidatus Poseidoniaceae archaeon]|jgi:DNA replicative helicase MCM subunit Mcm2 (Cdc46/Mcm family)|nr:hypothetical protein [Candidatus Poseidoniaceae archaeon]
MPQIRTTEPDDETQEILNTWRLIFENKYGSELDHFSLCEEDVFGFEVQWKYLKNTPLHSFFPNNPIKSLELGNQVIREQFQKRDSRTRPVIRIIGFDEEFSYLLEDVRTRDRGRLLSFNCIITNLDTPMGWLKRSEYVCNICGSNWPVRQSLARERKRSSHCSICAVPYYEEMKKTKGKSKMSPPTDVSMVVEANVYEDIQYLELTCPIMLEKHLNDETKNPLFHYLAVVNDEYVGNFSLNQEVTVNAWIQLDHLPNRDFAMDTRRVFIFKVHSIES